MEKALHRAAAAHDTPRKLDWGKRMSDHVAYALLAYTGLQIFVTMGALNTGHGSVLPYFALIVLVAAIIPGCRYMEKRWEELGDVEAGDPSYAGAFRRDAMTLWVCAIGLPFLLTYGYKAVMSLI
ncbi:MAG: hypothetical protein ABIT09_00680 [Croceibacterium sp.]